MRTRLSPSQTEYPGLNTEALRAAFLVDSLFTGGQVELVYTDADRAIVGSAVPTSAPLRIGADAELRAACFCERRELGLFNIGGNGAVAAGGQRFELGKLDCLYVGRGTECIELSSADPANPAAFYLLSYPAHATHPTTLARETYAAKVEPGSVMDTNGRTIHKYIYIGGIRSCQLVMGFTQLHDGAVWNTMPPHTHARRSEIYLYFNLGPNRRVMHFMGRPQETRHLVMSDRQAVISPSWSIHCACGTGAYAFCWGMGGENQTFEDMDAVALEQLR